MPWLTSAGRDDGRGPRGQGYEGRGDGGLHRRLQPADLPRHAGQRPADRYLVIPARMVRGCPARCGVVELKPSVIECDPSGSPLSTPQNDREQADEYADQARDASQP